MAEPEPPPTWHIGHGRTAYVDLQLIRPHLRVNHVVPGPSQAVVVATGDLVARKGDQEEEGAFILVKQGWAQKNAPRAFGAGGLGLHQMPADTGIPPEAWAYYLRGSPGRWLPAALVPSLTEHLLSLLPRGAMLYATINDDSLHLRPRRANHTEASLFVEAAYLVSRFHAMVSIVNAFREPEAHQPRLPFYILRDKRHGDRRVVSPIVVRRLLLQERISGVLPNFLKVPDDTEACEGVFTVSFARVNGSGFATVHKKKSESVPMILLDDVLAHPALREWRELTGRGHPSLPVVISNHPPNKGSTGKAGGDPGLEVATTVKCTLASRVQSGARDVLSDIVSDVSAASRFGSYLINLHFMRTLEVGNGVLPEAGSDFDGDLVRHAMEFARNGAPPAAAPPDLVESHSLFTEQLDGLRVASFPANSIRYDAKGYVTGTYTSIHQHGTSRLAGLVKAACVLESAYRPGLVFSIIMAIESGRDFPASDQLLQRVRDLIAKYRRLYVEKGLTGLFGSAINGIKRVEQRAAKFRRVMEIYYAIEKDHDILEAAAASLGWEICVLEEDEVDKEEEPVELLEQATVSSAASKSAASKSAAPKPNVWWRKLRGLLPVNRLGQRYVRFDNETWKTGVYGQLHDAGVPNLQPDDMWSLFTQGSKYRQDVRTLRCKQKGFHLGNSLMLDGTGGVIPFLKRAKQAAASGAASGALYVLRACDRVIGTDPGRVNILSCCVTMERTDLPPDSVLPPEGPQRRAAHSFSALTRNDYYERSGINEINRRVERRKVAHGREAHAALLETRRRTVRSAVFARYVAALGAHRAALEATYGGRNASGDRFMAWEGKTRTLDRYLTSLGQHKDMAGEGRLVMALGDGSFASTGPGERSVPTTGLSKRVKRAYAHRMDLVMVPEMNTTKVCCECHQEMEACQRQRAGRDGVMRWYKDRDVRRCNTPGCLESHPCVAAPSLLEGLHPRNLRPLGVLVDRDQNPALSIARLCGLKNEDRPAAFQDNRIRPNNVPV